MLPAALASASYACNSHLCKYAVSHVRSPTDVTNKGGRRKVHFAYIDEAVSVLHCNDGAQQVWMYELNASKCDETCPSHFSYTPLQSIIFSDTLDLAMYLNVTFVATYAFKRALMLRAQHALSIYKSIIFTAHVDSGACLTQRLKEIVEIR